MEINETDILNLIDVALGYVKDKALEEMLRNLAAVQREYYKKKAEQGRKKSTEIIKNMAKVDIEVCRLNQSYEKLKAAGKLPKDGCESIDSLIRRLQIQREEFLKEKKRLEKQRN